MRPLALLATALITTVGARQRPADRPPPPPPIGWRALIGEYGPDTAHAAMILEQDGRLIIRREGSSAALHPLTGRRFRLSDTIVEFRTDVRGRISELAIGATARSGPGAWVS